MGKIYEKLKRLFKFVKVDYSFLLFLVLLIFLDMLKVYFLYIVFILLHELSHLFVARRLGYFPKQLKITVFGASLEGFDDFLTLDEIKIILAGPMFNFFVIIMCYLSFWFWPESFEFLNDVLIVNQAILFFNILPIFPLDCGRILLCLCSIKKGRMEAVGVIKKASFCFMIVLFIISIFIFLFTFNLSFSFACVNLCILLFESANGTSFKREFAIRKKQERLSKGLMQKIIYVKNDYNELYLLKFIDSDHYFVFVFVDDNFKELQRIDEFELLKKLGFI